LLIQNHSFFSQITERQQLSHIFLKEAKAI